MALTATPVKRQIIALDDALRNGPDGVLYIPSDWALSRIKFLTANRGLNFPQDSPLFSGRLFAAC